MNIKGLNMDKISENIKKYLPDFIQEDFKFQESYMLEFGEINHNLPAKYHDYLNEDEQVNNASGSVEREDLEYNYTAIFIADGAYKKGLFIMLQKEHKLTSEVEIELIKSFIEDTIPTVEQLTNYYKTLTKTLDLINCEMDSFANLGLNENFKKILGNIILQSAELLYN